jgi:hypothetical protein
VDLHCRGERSKKAAVRDMCSRFQNRQSWRHQPTRPTHLVDRNQANNICVRTVDAGWRVRARVNGARVPIIANLWRANGRRRAAGQARVEAMDAADVRVTFVRRARV